MTGTRGTAGAFDLRPGYDRVTVIRGDLNGVRSYWHATAGVLMVAATLTPAEVGQELARWIAP